MNEQVVRHITPEETSLIQTVAQWYYDVWESPIAPSIEKLSEKSAQNNLAQLIMEVNSVPVTTGCLSLDPNILKVHPHLAKFSPWISMIVTPFIHRKKGYATAILHFLESEAIRLQYQKVYLYTFTAESMYKKCGYRTIDTVLYKGHQTVVMLKEI